MKTRAFLVGVLLTLLAELIVLVIFAVQTPDFSQDAVAVNEVLQSVTKDFNALDAHHNSTDFNYVVLDNDDKVLYRTRLGLSESVNTAIIHRDTILDIEVDGTIVGKVLIYNDGAKTLQTQRNKAIGVLAAVTAVQVVICTGYAVYMHRVIVRPFRKLKGFAERIAEGNLDIPLEMDRHNIFGAFTESFDIMRSELKKARLAEAEANASKKELVAKLSHDIKTPVASIKAASELGLALSDDAKIRETNLQIIGKADQIDTLVSNLFTAALEELRQISVSPTDVGSKVVKELLKNADYLKRAEIPDIPECLIVADRLRLQQVFDNIFANSYKYAGTEIKIFIKKSDTALTVTIEDFGGGVSEEELPLLTEKFRRGSNATDKDGAGLGLYISDYFMKEMGGSLKTENGEKGLRVIVTVRLSGAI